MSFLALNSALSGLRAAQAQLNTISTNVANATTPGYSRKITPQTAQVINSTGETIGVRSGVMIRQVDLNLERELWTQISVVSARDVKASYLASVEQFHGPSNKELSIAAEISQLKDKFAALSDSPSDGFLLQSTLTQAENVVTKFNDFGKLITQLRNDAQDEMVQTVDRINTILKTVAQLNGNIKGAANVGGSTAALEDRRDEAVKELSGLIDVNFFMRGDGVMVIQTRTGVHLTDEKTQEVFFAPERLGPTTTYPGSVSGIWIGGNPISTPSAVDVTLTGLGGKIGGLVELRDQTLVQYQTQIDELAHKLALRMEAQGLRLFTDGSGGVPLDTPPSLSPPPVSVTYVGFATKIQVNDSIRNDVTLIQQGTYASDRSIPAASNEVIRRVIQFGFGDVNYQQAAGATNLNVTAPATDMQQWLGLYSTNNVVGGINLASFAQISDGVAGTSDLMEDLDGFFTGPANDQFQITFSDPRLGIPDMTITVDLSDAQAAFPINGTTIKNALDQIIAQVNSQISTAVAGTPAYADFAATATRNSYGQLVINSRSNTTFNANGFPNAMGAEAFGAMGLQERTYAVEDPYFDVQVGTGTPIRITLAPGDDVNDLIAKMEYNSVTGTGVPGLSVSFDALTGRLTLRPGMDDTNGGPRFGGDIKIIAGPTKTSGAVNPVLAALPQGVSMAAAIFGSYTVNGGNVSESSPVTNVKYGSETFAGSGVFVDFRRDHLGPAADIKSGILTGANLADFAQKMVSAHGQDVVSNDALRSDGETLKALMQERVMNNVGVNIDEEMSNLIVVQTAYAAAARAVSAASDMFDELLAAFR